MSIAAARTRSQAGQKVGLRRDLGIWESYATLIGVLIGSGIFVVTGQAGAVAGPSVPLAYLVMYPIVICTAVAYMVFLSTPLGERPGGAYIHISRTFGTYYPGYIAMWLKWVAFMGALGVLSLGFGQYVTFFIPGANPVLVGSLVLLFFYFINLFGVRLYGWAQVAMFLVLMIAVLVLVIPGLPAVNLSYYRPLFPFGLKGFLAAIPPLFLSYAGFESLAQTAGETREARRSLPRVFLVGLSITVVIYFAMSFVAFGNLPYQQLAHSRSAMADVAARYLPFGAAAIVAVGAMMAFTTSINGTLMVPPRVLMVLAEDRMIPGFLAHINPRFRTPDVALTISTGVALALLWTKTLDYILAVTLQAMFILYIVHGIALICLPFVNPRLYKTALVRLHPALLVISGLISIAAMLLFSYAMIIAAWRLLLLWVAVGTGIYLYSRYQGRREGFDYQRRLVEEWCDEAET
ncbi:APC family permease [Neomoorella thermoacetica]|uniref:APC family permease n=1 Tax=Neomoorella thermoacetica TaxID=1525 RepID=UPI0008FA78E5|nr:APC family permease [Moorella thermoacetica]OIQ10477.1 serine/threonine exchanger SteT [Moorella thermoacetica]